MAPKKKIKTSPKQKEDTSFHTTEMLSDSEIASMRKEFHQALLEAEKRDGHKLKLINFGEPLPED